MFQSDPISLSLAIILAAAFLFYFGMRALWAGSPGSGLIRGAILATPIIFISIVFTCLGAVGIGIALLLTCSVFLMTLGVGTIAMNAPANEGIGLSQTRLLIPLCLMTCLIGFHGGLTLLHAAMLLIVGSLVFWSASGNRSIRTAAVITAWLAIATFLLAGGIVLIVLGSKYFQAAVGASVVTPLVVLMIGPAALIGTLGLFGRPSNNDRDAAFDTITGFVVTCLGFGQAAVIALGIVLNRWVPVTTRLHDAVVMPLVTWRIDSILLVVLSIIFLPASIGRWKFGRMEGFALIALYLIYARVAVHTANLGG